MSLDYIVRSYGVAAKRGGRVRYTGGKEPRLGTITGASDGHLSIRLDGEKHANPYHPTWEIEYLDPASTPGAGS
jgi:hypothetical protein